MAEKKLTERILLPLDGSKVGEAALPYVEDLLRKLVPAVKVEVTLIQVVSSLYHYVILEEEAVQAPYTEKEIEQLEKQAGQYLGKAGASLRKLGATVKTVVTVGNPADEIIRTADEIDADIIAMSSHGRSGFSRWAFGSITDRVLRGGRRPALVVKAPREP